jgi:ABC-type Mn2+/Zn2+ transport system ATPase subunit
MEGRFEVKFPRMLELDGTLSIVFTLQKGKRIVFSDGIYYLDGDNGSGKTTFISMLALTAGRIGTHAGAGEGMVMFNHTVYNDSGFGPVAAAALREKYFCIYPQKAFFLPVSTRDNYMMLNGSDPEKAKQFSSREHPDLLSGGQQQKVLMDIVLDDQKPVWFLDEPLTNLDAERRRYFWQTLRDGYGKKVKTVFFIDHWMGDDIRKDPHFIYCNTLHAVLENRNDTSEGNAECKQIDLFVNNSPETFFIDQIRKAGEQ